MFTQEKLKPIEETISPVTCDGCSHSCRIHATRDECGIIYPTIGMRVIKCYLDNDGKHQIVFPQTCPTLKAAQRLGAQLTQLCDKYKQNSR